MRRVALAFAMGCLFVAGFALAQGPPPGFCTKHPAHPKCQTSTTAPTTGTTSTITAPGTAFGISDGADLVYEADATRLRELDSMQAVGAKWVRYDFAWSVIEPVRGAFNVAYLDTAVREAQAHGLDVLAMIAYAPGWANGGRDDKYPPLNPADYATISGKLAAHFGPLGVHHYELWNEPNLGCCFWKPRADPDAYAALVRAAYPAIHNADAQATVLIGVGAPAGGYHDANCDGVYGDLVNAAGNMNALDYLERLNTLDMPYDAFSHHPYDGSGDFTGRCSAWAQMADTSPSVRSLMAEHGDSGKQLWATEYGNIVPDWTSEQGQADRLTKAMTLWKSYPWAGVFFEFNLWDAHGSAYGLLRSDFTQRPAWFAFQTAAR